VTAVQLDAETIQVNWGGFRDPESTVKAYTVCLGTTPGAQDFAECMFVELDEEYVFDFVDIIDQDGVVVYASVFAENGEGLESIKSAKLTLDDSAPEVTKFHLLREWDNRYVSQPLLKHSDTTGVAMRLKVREFNPSVNVTIVEIAIGLGPESFQDAMEWTEVLHDFNTDPTYAKISYTGLAFQHGVEYYIHVRTANTIGRQQIVTMEPVLYIDTTPAEPKFVNPHNGRSIMLEYNLKWLKFKRIPKYSATYWTVAPYWSFRDDESEIERCRIRLLDADGDPASPVATRWTRRGMRMTRFRRGVNMPQGFRYEVHVRCQNDAALWSEMYSETVTIDRTRPFVRQIVDLAEEPASSSLAIVAEPGSRQELGFTVPPLLPPFDVARLDIDFVAELDTLRVGFAAWDEDSGVQFVHVAVGTSPGSTSVLRWTRVKVKGKRHFVVPLRKNTRVRRHRRYFVSIAAINVSHSVRRLMFVVFPNLSHASLRVLACCPIGKAQTASWLMTRPQFVSSIVFATATTGSWTWTSSHNRKQSEPSGSRPCLIWSREFTTSMCASWTWTLD